MYSIILESLIFVLVTAIIETIFFYTINVPKVKNAAVSGINDGIIDYIEKVKKDKDDLFNKLFISNISKNINNSVVTSYFKNIYELLLFIDKSNNCLNNYKLITVVIFILAMFIILCIIYIYGINKKYNINMKNIAYSTIITLIFVGTAQMILILLVLPKYKYN